LLFLTVASVPGVYSAPWSVSYQYLAYHALVRYIPLALEKSFAIFVAFPQTNSHRAETGGPSSLKFPGEPPRPFKLHQPLQLPLSSRLTAVSRVRQAGLSIFPMFDHP
jgi:hypothetical protein